MYRYFARLGRRRVAITLVVCVSTLVLALASCGGDDGTVAPKTGSIPPPDPDLPQVPTLASPNDDPVMRSESVAHTRGARDYAPLIVSAMADWHVRGYLEYEESPFWINCNGGWRDLYGSEGGKAAAWSDEIPAAEGCLTGCLLYLPMCGVWPASVTEWPADARPTFIRDGDRIPPPYLLTWKDRLDERCRLREIPSGKCLKKYWLWREINAEVKDIEKQPYIRRTRFWAVQKWESGATVQRIDGDNEVQMTTTYTTGCENTQTESFAYTLGGSVGGTLEVLSATIEASMTKTFETSVTVSNQQQTSVTKILKGDAGKITCHVMWVLIERYTFVDDEGNRFGDPNYVFHEGFTDPFTDEVYDFEIQGKQEHLAKYIFDHDGALLEMVLVE